MLKQSSSALSIKFVQKTYKNIPEQQLLKTTRKKCKATLRNYRENSSGIPTTHNRLHSVLRENEDHFTFWFNDGISMSLQ